MNAWDMWKKGFDAWEGATAKYFEQVLKNPLLLGPSGALMAAAMKTKAEADKATNQFINANLRLVVSVARKYQCQYASAVSRLTPVSMSCVGTMSNRATRPTRSG